VLGGRPAQSTDLIVFFREQAAAAGEQAAGVSRGLPPSAEASADRRSAKREGWSDAAGKP